MHNNPREKDKTVKHVNIPTQWSAAEALSIVAFLQRVIDATWRAHGEKMAGFICLNFPEPRRHSLTGPRSPAHHPRACPNTPLDDDLDSLWELPEHAQN